MQCQCCATQEYWIKAILWDECLILLIFQQSVTVPHECHCVTGLPLTVWRIFKNDPLAEIQDRKGTPFENFRRASWPIRSQDSELSTNQRPRFQGNSWHQPNFYCVPGVPLNQFPSNILPNMPMECKFVTGMSLNLKLTLPIECHSTATGLSLECHSTVTGMSLECHWT